MSSANVKIATDQNFVQEVLGNGKPVLVDFWATWCAPCRAIAPVIDALADSYVGKIDVYKMDVDSNPETPAKFGIRGIPTIILFKGGRAFDQVVGAVPREQLENLIKRAG